MYMYSLHAYMLMGLVVLHLRILPAVSLEVDPQGNPLIYIIIVMLYFLYSIIMSFMFLCVHLRTCTYTYLRAYVCYSKLGLGVCKLYIP